MTEKKWPSFVTRDLGDSPEDDVEMLRRWQVYEGGMKALIAAGGLHQDDDGWWVETATGELIRSINAHAEFVRALAFSPDGNSVVSGGAEHCHSYASG